MRGSRFCDEWLRLFSFRAVADFHLVIKEAAQQAGEIVFRAAWIPAQIDDDCLAITGFVQEGIDLIVAQGKLGQLPHQDIAAFHGSWPPAIISRFRLPDDVPYV